MYKFVDLFPEKFVFQVFGFNGAGRPNTHVYFVTRKCPCRRQLSFRCGTDSMFCSVALYRAHDILDIVFRCGLDRTNLSLLCFSSTCLVNLN